MTGPGRTALIAGRGALPRIIAAALDSPLVAALDGFAPDGLVPDLTFRIERLVPFLDHLTASGVCRVVFAGAVQRPRLDPSLFDSATAQLVPQLLAAMQGGDDAALRAVIAIFEEAGLAVVGVDQVAPDLVPGPGLLAGEVTEADRRDAARAAQIVAALGAADVGQGAVVAQGLCLAVEALPGTDAMLDFVAHTGAALRPDPKGARGLLYKAPKPGQDRRIDLPALGPATVAAAARAGLGRHRLGSGRGDAAGPRVDGRGGGTGGPVPVVPRAMKLYLIAGEPSGDRLGAALMAGLKSLHPGVEFHGIGGPLMQAEGMTSLFPMDELSVMGLAEVLPKYAHLKRRIRQTAQDVLRLAPVALITIDSPDFVLRVAGIVRAANPAIRTIHYVAPSVWAWRPGRAAKMARVVDHVLALLPFEPPYMTAAGMTCDFVGHPVVAEPRATAQEAQAFRADLGAEGPVILALPGSRRGEVSRLAPVIGGVLGRVSAVHPKARVVLPTLCSVAPMVEDLTAGWPIAPLIVEAPEAKRAAFAAADVAIAASGTVSLELAANGVPMVIAYDMHPVTMWLMRRMARVDTVTLVNLVSDTRVVPEFLGDRCRPDLIAPALLHLLEPGAARDAQQAAMRLTMERLGQGGEAPGIRAARSVLAVIAAQGGR
jgi:lipid-A-disaccharide synthase